MNKFDITEYPPDQSEIDARLLTGRKNLFKFRKKMALIALFEVCALLGAYAGGLMLTKSIGMIGYGLLIIGIGPVVAVIAVTITAMVRGREIKVVIEDLMPASAALLEGLKGRAPEIDRYLAQIEELGRSITQAEVKMLRKFRAPAAAQPAQG